MFLQIERQIANGGRLNNITRHVLGLYHGRPRGRQFRRILSEDGQRPGAGVEVLKKAMAVAEGEGALVPAAE
jgi:tRNA-dihydrouridine synthase A